MLNFTAEKPAISNLLINPKQNPGLFGLKIPQ